MNTQNISPADEREAREWLAKAIVYDGGKFPTIQADKHRATILALLDRRMPRPEDVPDNVCAAMFWAGSSVATPDMPVIARGRHVYQAMYDILTAPPAPVKVEAWGIAAPNGEIIHVRKTQDAARQRAKHCPADVRIVHLREVEADQCARRESGCGWRWIVALFCPLPRGKRGVK